MRVAQRRQKPQRPVLPSLLTDVIPSRQARDLACTSNALIDSYALPVAQKLLWVEGILLCAKSFSPAG
jgi:hypothetical protein